MASIIKKIKSEFDKGLASVSVNSSTLIETTKINGIIASLKEKRELLINSLGELIYEEMLDKTEVNEDDKLQMFNEILEIDNKINEKLETIKKINDEKKEVILMISKEKAEDQTQESIDNENICECGQKIKENAKFCIGCGKPVQIKETPLCTCGAKIKENAKFCSSCGDKFEI